MIPIPSKFRADGYDFTLLDRVDDWAVFRKTKGEIESYEVVVVQKRPAHTWPNGNTTPAHEAMPSSEMWGTAGWTLDTQAKAYSKVADLLKTRQTRLRASIKQPEAVSGASLKG
jgi:hypothetical protein